MRPVSSSSSRPEPGRDHPSGATPARPSTRVPPWLPNAISGARVVMVPVWILLAEHVRARHLADAPVSGAILPGLLLALGFSDILDGFLARRFKLDSRLGEILDAAADKLAQVAFVTYLALRGPPVWPTIPVAFAALVVGRDVVLATGFWVLRARAGAVDTTHRVHGKVSSVLLFLVVLAAVTPGSTWLVGPLVLASTGAIVISTAGYLRQGLRRVSSPSNAPSS